MSKIVLLLFLLSLAVQALGQKKLTEQQKELIERFEAKMFSKKARERNIVVDRVFNFTHQGPLTIPIPVNLLYVSSSETVDSDDFFEKSQIAEWFDHLEHQIHHQQVPVGEKITSSDNKLQTSTMVDYQVTINFVQVSSEFGKALEKEIQHNLRRESVKGRVHYVDAFQISSMINDFLQFAGLGNFYNFFVLNLERPSPDITYGYRVGFSQEEIDLLLSSNFKLPPRIPSQGLPSSSFPSPTADAEAPEVPQGKQVAMIDMRAKSRQWASSFSTRRNSVFGGPPNCDGLAEDDPRCRGLPQVRSELPIEQLAEQMIQTGRSFEVNYLADLAQKNRFANCLVDVWIGHGRAGFVDLAAGPFAWEPTLTQSKGSKTFATLPALPEALSHFSESTLGSQGRLFGLDLQNGEQGSVLTSDSEQYYKEAQIMQRYQEKMCSDPALDGDEFCRDVAQLLQNFEKKLPLQVPIISGDLDEGRHSNRATDQFFAKLANVISSAIHHLVVPPSPLFPSVFYEQITFVLYIIKNQNSYDVEEYFSFQDFQDEISTLKLPGQKFNFQNIPTNRDPQLSVAFASSLKSLKFPGDTKLHTFIDSKELQHQLLSHTDFQPEQTPKTHTIPIFLISIDSAEHILIDKYYQARALQDMVIVVQNSLEQWEVPVACNGKRVQASPRNPLKQALAYTALLFGGLLHTHVGFDPVTHTATQQWIWSVGDSPMAYLHSSGAPHFSQFQKDIVLRNYLVHAANASITAANRATAQLLDSPGFSSLQNAKDKSVSSGQNRRFQLVADAFANLQTAWQNLAENGARAKGNSVQTTLNTLHDATDRYEKAVESALLRSEIAQCATEDERSSGSASAALSWSSVVIVVCAGVVDVLIVWVWRNMKKKKKIKIN